MTYQEIHLIQTDGNSPAQQCWALLRQLDTALAELQPNSIGQSRGDRLNLQWWVDESGQHFALQVHDRHEQHQWELCCLPVPGNRLVAGRRSLARRDDTTSPEPDSPWSLIWQNLFDHRCMEPLGTANHPSFIDILATGISSTGVISVREDSATIANLRADLDYFQQLARNLDRQLHRQSKANRGWELDDGEAATESKPESVEEDRYKGWTMRDIERWVAENAGRIVVLPRAISEAKGSNYERPELVFRALDLLAGTYTKVKAGQADRHSLKAEAEALGLSLGGSVEPSVAGSRGDEYFIRWRGQRRFLDQHLKRGNARDPRYSLRIYFTWDEQDQQVVVGWLPSHLGTGST